MRPNNGTNGHIEIGISKQKLGAVAAQLQVDRLDRTAGLFGDHRPNLSGASEGDFATIAQGFGAEGITIRTMDDLAQVEHWVADGAEGTLVVDLRISRNVVAPYIEEIIELTIKR